MDVELEKKLKELNLLIDVDKNQTQTHLKGYIYDSLIYRYKLARRCQTEYEIDHEGKCMEHKHDYDYYIRAEERDVMRFIQILDEIIGEHD